MTDDLVRSLLLCSISIDLSEVLLLLAALLVLTQSLVFILPASAASSETDALADSLATGVQITTGVGAAGSAVYSIVQYMSARRFSQGELQVLGNWRAFESTAWTDAVTARVGPEEMQRQLRSALAKNIHDLAHSKSEVGGIRVLAHPMPSQEAIAALKRALNLQLSGMPMPEPGQMVPMTRVLLESDLAQLERGQVSLRLVPRFRRMTAPGEFLYMGPDVGHDPKRATEELDGRKIARVQVISRENAWHLREHVRQVENILPRSTQDRQIYASRALRGGIVTALLLGGYWLNEEIAASTAAAVRKGVGWLPPPIDMNAELR